MRRFGGGRRGSERASGRANERARWAVCQQPGQGRGRAQRGSPRGLLLVAGLFLAFRLHPPFKGRLNVIREGPQTGHYRNNKDRRGEQASGLIVSRASPHVKTQSSFHLRFNRARIMKNYDVFFCKTLMYGVYLHDVRCLTLINMIRVRYLRAWGLWHNRSGPRGRGFRGKGLPRLH